MRLLIITQKVDKNEPILGFFHRWIEEFAKHYEFVTVICLEMGEYHLPANVRVLSLGKEERVSNVRYIVHFYKYIWQERKNYDAVFVHMNQEYVLLGGLFWKLCGKKIFLWRNHAKGNLLTRLAVLLSDKVFYTSPSSFTARFKKAIQMPVGIDTEFFKADQSIERMPDSVLFLGRISPVKKVLEFIDWVKTTPYSATIAGPILPADKEYGEIVQHRMLDNKKIKYIRSVNQEGARKLYQTHEIYVNKTPAGSFDKTILEALACGMKLMIDNPDAQNINVVEHSLDKLMERLSEEMR